MHCETPLPQSSLAESLPSESVSENVTLVSRPGKRMPRPRDIWIFDEVVLFGRTQRDVARELGMTQPRISQIVNTMIAWLGPAGTGLAAVHPAAGTPAVAGRSGGPRAVHE